MKFKIPKEQLLTLLNSVGTAVERRNAIAILSNIKLDVKADQITVSATDTEVELIASTSLQENQVSQEGEITIPARKLIDLCKSLPAASEVSIEVDMSTLQCTIKAAKSRFKLHCLPAIDFPCFTREKDNQSLDLGLTQYNFKRLLDKTCVCMAVQDVRFYLAGILLHFDKNAPHSLNAVATDGHRLAYCESEIESLSRTIDRDVFAILPRKAVNELQRLIGNTDDLVNINLTRELISLTNQVEVKEGSPISITFTSKLIDGKYPDYKRVIPNNNKFAMVDTHELRQAIQRVAILSNEKLRSVMMNIEDNLITIRSRNNEADEAFEQVDVQFDDTPVEVSFNSSYLQDAFNALDADEAILELGEQANSQIVIKCKDDPTCLYVVMPMRS